MASIPRQKPLSGFKRCAGCKLILPAESFYPCKGRPNGTGLSSRCKPCVSARAKRLHELHPERRKAYNRKYYDREKRVAYNRQWIAANRERKRAQSQKWKRENRDKVLESSRRYYQNNKAAHMDRWRARRARKANAAGQCSASQLAARFAVFGGRCWVCGDTATDAEHVIPLARGGSNWPANMRPACRACNLSKGSKDWRWWASLFSDLKGEPHPILARLDDIAESLRAE